MVVGRGAAMVELLLQRRRAKLDGDALVAHARGEDELAVVSGLVLLRERWRSKLGRGGVAKKLTEKIT